MNAFELICAVFALVFFYGLVAIVTAGAANSPNNKIKAPSEAIGIALGAVWPLTIIISILYWAFVPIPRALCTGGIQRFYEQVKKHW